jgi:hypothetical protein
MKNSSKNASPPPNRARELRSELARKIASFIGTKEKLITDVPGLLLSRRTAPTTGLSDLRAKSGRGRARAQASRPRRDHVHLR